MPKKTRVYHNFSMYIGGDFSEFFDLFVRTAKLDPAINTKNLKNPNQRTSAAIRRLMMAYLMKYAPDELARLKEKKALEDKEN